MVNLIITDTTVYDDIGCNSDTEVSQTAINASSKYVYTDMDD